MILCICEATHGLRKVDTTRQLKLLSYWALWRIRPVKRCGGERLTICDIAIYSGMGLVCAADACGTVYGTRQ